MPSCASIYQVLLYVYYFDGFSHFCYYFCSLLLQFGPEGQEWLVASAKSDFNEILRLLKIHPTLARHKVCRPLSVLFFYLASPFIPAPNPCQTQGTSQSVSEFYVPCRSLSFKLMLMLFLGECTIAPSSLATPANEKGSSNDANYQLLITVILAFKILSNASLSLIRWRTFNLDW